MRDKIMKHAFSNNLCCEILIRVCNLYEFLLAILVTCKVDAGTRRLSVWPCRRSVVRELKWQMARLRRWTRERALLGSEAAGGCAVTRQAQCVVAKHSESFP